MCQLYWDQKMYVRYYVDICAISADTTAYKESKITDENSFHGFAWPPGSHTLTLFPKIH